MSRIAQLVMFLLMVAVVLLLAGRTQAAHALPEYSAQVGEPCASCHLSPSGGGSRGARGQAWVGSGKPGTVPDQETALSILGVRLEVKKADYVAGTAPVPLAQPLAVKPGGEQKIFHWLMDYPGN